MTRPEQPVGDGGAIDRARRELHAARAILDRAPGSGRPAVGHLRAAWQALGEPAVAGGLADLTAGTPDQPTTLPPRRILRRHARALAAVLRDRELAALGLDRRLRRLLPWAWALLAATCAAALLAAWTVDRLRTAAPAWRAEFHDNPTLAGPPLVRWYRDLRLAWGTGSPARGIPWDGFSARIDTCLRLPRDADTAWLVDAHDDARLYIDGALVVDDSGEHRRRARGGRLDLAAGIHHLVVEYRHMSGNASVLLLASLDGRPPAPIPRDLLRRPGDDPQAPCR